MRGKLVIISLLAALLVYTVYRMMVYENSIREEKKVKLYVEDESKALINKLNSEALKTIAENSDYYFRADGNYFKKLETKLNPLQGGTNWDDFFIKGVNLGVAVPGKFPAEFSLTFDQYVTWLVMIGEMNANVIRTYTILPPDFYDAFAWYNLHHHDKPLYLMQGVWTEVPESHNYYDAPFMRSFQKEIIDVIDVIHGKALIRERPGKASGVYSTDVSKYVIALLLGREWEPSTVFKTNQLNPVKSYSGDFVCMNDGNAMEAWLALMLDFCVLYETQSYQFQHPVSFVNWLPLDPMYHSTEIIENDKVREFDNDMESIDFSKFNSTELFYPGIFAAYHAYPYYPDFIYLQDSYADSAKTDLSKNSYYFYLRDLKSHTRGMPLIIAEYGLPSSRGNSHYSPFGYHQGGHPESGQAALSLSLTKDIVRSDCGGAIYFEWIDEWFKHNWLVEDFERPSEDRKLWHNMENPEQNFGIMAMEDRIKKIDGELNDWNVKTAEGEDVQIMADADAGYFYLALKIPGFDFSNNNLYLAFDTYDKEKGDHKLPFTNELFDNGFEFLAEFKSPANASILVDEPYSVFTDIYKGHIPVIQSKNNNNGKFIRQLMLANRGRVSLTGKVTEERILDRSGLVFGKTGQPLRDKNSNADWYFNKEKGILEVRIDWHLLNVSDPAKHYVLDDKAGTPDIEITKTEAFRLYAFVTDKNNRNLRQYPENSPYSWLWEEWNMPAYRQRLKPLYYTLQNYFGRDLLKPVSRKNTGTTNESFHIAGYRDDKKAAISISFDDAAYSQYQYALPVLTKYGLAATFGIEPGLLDNSFVSGEQENISYKRLQNKEIKEIAGHHEIAVRLPADKAMTTMELHSLLVKQDIRVNTVHYAESASKPALPPSVLFGRESLQKSKSTGEFRGINYTLLNPSQPIARLDSLLNIQGNKWTIFLYRHFYQKPEEVSIHGQKGVIPPQYISLAEFEKHVRLFRNTDYWIAPEGSVFKYLMEKQSSRISTNKFKNIIFLKVQNTLDPAIYDYPLTIIYTTNAHKIRISGSETDGSYTNYNGTIIFNVMPNKEVTLEILE